MGRGSGGAPASGDPEPHNLYRLATALRTLGALAAARHDEDRTRSSP